MLLASTYTLPDDLYAEKQPCLLESEIPRQCEARPGCSCQASAAGLAFDHNMGMPVEESPGPEIPDSTKTQEAVTLNCTPRSGLAQAYCQKVWNTVPHRFQLKTVAGKYAYRLTSILSHTAVNLQKCNRQPSILEAKRRNVRDQLLYKLLKPGEKASDAIQKYDARHLMAYRTDIFSDKYRRLRMDGPAPTIMASQSRWSHVHSPRSEATSVYHTP